MGAYFYDYSGSTPITVSVYVDCIHASFDLGLELVGSANTAVAANTTATIMATCPAGETAVGGGFDSAEVTEESAAEFN